MAKGMFNSGFISTQAGTLGRTLGNSSIYLAGMLGGDYELENYLFIPSTIFMVGILVLTVVEFKKL